MKIKKLSPDVIDQIAAGEVLERPSSLVKELVENSLDAKSSEIDIYVTQGGRSVVIQDNGHGIDKADLLTALERHATSKIDKASDLWRLSSFGFRGEALASVAAVSRLTLTSRVMSADTAYQVVSQFGERSDITPVGGAQGTRIEVSELFANVPARLKFLKAESAETLQIKKTLKALAMNHPEVTFRLYVDEKLSLHWPAVESLKSRVEDVLEKNNLIESEFLYKTVRLKAVFGSPHVVEKTSQNIWFFVNGRWIQDKSLQMAVLEAYRHLLMHGEYPVAVVQLSVPPEDVDVNVSPTKSQVKFRDPKEPFRAIHLGLRQELEKGPWLQKVFATPQTLGVQQETSPVEASHVQSTLMSTDGARDGAMERTQFPQKQKINLETLKNYAPPERVNQSRTFAPSEVTSSTEVPRPAEATTWGHLQVLGQANLTYILAQSSKSLILIDQHAAHERVMFEKLMKSWRENSLLEIQNFLIPMSLNLEEALVEALLTHTEELEKLGITIEQGGPQTILVIAVPSLLKESAVFEMLKKTAQEILKDGDSYSFEKKIGDLIASMACHSAIRAGQALSLEEMKALLVQMEEFPLSSFCPHGRPVYTETTFRELDIKFGRIV